MTLARLTGRQAHLLATVAGVWTPILYGRDDQRLTDRLLRLKLATADGYPAPKGKAWSLVPTQLGRALGCLLHRRTGGKLKRVGVQNLAKHRAHLLATFDIEGAVAGLVTERAALAKVQFERIMREERDVAARARRSSSLTRALSAVVAGPAKKRGARG